MTKLNPVRYHAKARDLMLAIIIIVLLFGAQPIARALGY